MNPENIMWGEKENKSRVKRRGRYKKYGSKMIPF